MSAAIAARTARTSCTWRTARRGATRTGRGALGRGVLGHGRFLDRRRVPLQSTSPRYAHLRVRLCGWLGFGAACGSSGSMTTAVPYAQNSVKLPIAPESNRIATTAFPAAGLRLAPHPAHDLPPRLVDDLRVLGHLAASSERKPAVKFCPKFAERTVSPITSPSTWVIRYPGTSLVVTANIKSPRSVVFSSCVPRLSRIG